MSSWTAADVHRVKERNGKTSKPSKYKNQKTVVEGIVFDSKKEARRYQELLALSKAGQVRKLRLQPRYGLCPLRIDKADPRDFNAGIPSARRLPEAYYVADFEYEESNFGTMWNLIVEDTKGVKTETYRLKQRWFEASYGVKIRET